MARVRWLLAVVGSISLVLAGAVDAKAAEEQSWLTRALTSVVASVLETSDAAREALASAASEETGSIVGEVVVAPPSEAEGAEFIAAVEEALALAVEEVLASVAEEQAAEAGDVEAQFNLGVRYATGHGVETDELAAFEWYSRAASQGYQPARVNLGLMYADGLGISQDETVAVELYRQAADQGYAPAQFNLGWMYATGRGVEKDELAAFELYRQAADQGYAPAQFNLGWMYATGRGGVTQNTVTAHMWLNLAAAQGDAEARQRRDLFAVLMTVEDLTTAQQAASDWEPSQSRDPSF